MPVASLSVACSAVHVGCVSNPLSCDACGRVYRPPFVVHVLNCFANDSRLATASSNGALRIVADPLQTILCSLWKWEKVPLPVMQHKGEWGEHLFFAAGITGSTGTICNPGSTLNLKSELRHRAPPSNFSCLVQCTLRLLSSGTFVNLSTV